MAFGIMGAMAGYGEAEDDDFARPIRAPSEPIFRPGVSSATFQYLSSYTWGRVMKWLRRKHRRISWKDLRRRYCAGGLVASRGRTSTVRPRQGRHHPLPLPGHGHPHPLAGHRMNIATSLNRDLRSARCPETGTPGAGNGPEKRAGRKTRQRKQLETALAKATASITAMIEAFQEQLLTIDELRSRMPDLRARQANLRNQISALETQLADRDASLKLAGDLEGFLAQLHASTATAAIEERQRVLRLLVKDILVGPEKITIRHRIPTRERATTGPRPASDDTEGDHRPVIHCAGGVTTPP
jgi:Group II intron, maturase-specific domain